LYNAGPALVKAAIGRVDPTTLDWRHRSTHRTAFYVALSKTVDQDTAAVAELFVPYAAAGFIDPYDVCFDADPISGNLSLSVLGMARMLYDDYAAVHLPKLVAAAWPGMPPPLVDLMRDYVAFRISYSTS
jgi:hypothetical protein